MSNFPKGQQGLLSNAVAANGALTVDHRQNGEPKSINSSIYYMLQRAREACATCWMRSRSAGLPKRSSRQTALCRDVADWLGG